VIGPQRRATILDALRRGTVPKEGLGAFAVGMERFAGAVDADLAAVSPDTSPSHANLCRTRGARLSTPAALPGLLRAGGVLLVPSLSKSWRIRTSSELASAFSELLRRGGGGSEAGMSRRSPPALPGVRNGLLAIEDADVLRR